MIDRPVSEPGRQEPPPSPGMPGFPSGARPPIVIALAGNPNVGKSTLFNRLTGSKVETAHYAGTTATVAVGEAEWQDGRLGLLDLPGSYGLAATSGAERIAREALLVGRPDSVVAVIDPSNLARNLTFVLQLRDLGAPVVVALNLADEAERCGVRVDVPRLGALLGSRTVETIAVQGTGLTKTVTAAVEASRHGWRDPAHRYVERVEAALAPVVSRAGEMPEPPYGLPPRACALQALQGLPDIEAVLRSLPGGQAVLDASAAARERLALKPSGVRALLSEERSRIATALADATATKTAPNPRRSLASLATSPVTGVPILLAVLLAVFGVLFFLGDMLAGAFSSLWQATASPVIQSAVKAIAGEGVVATTLLWGLDAGVEASLSIGLPYILTFYLLLALLEDSGYLGSVAFLTDRLMHRFGLHGRAVIPLVAAGGCSVPALLATRSLGGGRERLIASTLVVTVPCSARTAVILGAVGHYVGWAPAAGVFATAAGVTVLAGIALDRFIPGQTRGIVMEMFPFRRPAWRPVLAKAWDRFREFLVVATPIVVIGSIVLGGLYETGWLWALARPLAPVVEGWLGLPAVAGLTLLLGLLRKELALQLLATLAIVQFGDAGHDLRNFMSSTDVFVYALVNTLAVPCVSAVAVLGAELGWRRAAGVVAMTISAALLLGGVFARLLPAVWG